MFRRISSTLFLLIILSRVSLIAQADTATLRILHWNDFHAQNYPVKMTAKDSAGQTYEYYVGGTAALSGYINEYKQDRNDVLVLNAGDDFQGTPISAMTNGKSQIELMNIIHPDAVTLGNHEFDYGVANLQAALRETTYSVICSNIRWKKNKTTLVPAAKIFTVGRLKVGIFGLTPPDLELLTMKNNLAGLELTDINNTADACIKKLKEEHADLIILLSHMGVDKDTMLAAKRNDIDIIVGGHTHTPLFTPIKKNHTIIVQAGSKGQYLGDLDLLIDMKGDSVLSYNGELIETLTDSVELNQLAVAKVDGFEAHVDSILGEVIGTLDDPWLRQQGMTESNIGDWECDVAREAAKSDVAFLNGAGIRKNLDAGAITIRDIWEINPFGNTFTTFTVSGAMLKKMVEWQTSVNPREFLQESGLKYVFDSRKPAGERLLSLKLNKGEVNDTLTYRIATNNYVATHLHDFFGITETLPITDTGIMDREAFIEKIRATKKITSKLDRRIAEPIREEEK